nr:reverse transcriptase domain-containing protein [Tanacetum cinerariifolium]
MAAEGNGDLPVHDLRTMEELCQPSLNGRGGPIALIAIQEINFGLKNDMIQQVQNSCQFHCLSGDNANKHLEKFLHVTQSIKVNGVTDDALCLYPFPHSLTHHATTWGTTKEETSSSKELIKANDAILKNMQTNMTSLTNSNLELKNMFGQFMKMNTASSSGSGTLPGNTITDPKEELKGITTRSGTAYQGPTIPTTTSSSSPVVERETEATKDMVHPTNNISTKDVQPPVVQTVTLIFNSEPIVAPIIEPVASPVSAPKPNQKLSIPYPSRFQDQKLRDKANDQREKFFQIFKDLNFNISFADALILVPKFGPSIKSLLTNKDKIFELARTSLNEHCSAVLLKKLPEKLWDLGNDVIDMACEEYSQEVLGFFDVIASGNPTPYYDLIVSTTSPTLTPFENSDFLLEEVDAFLALEDDPTLPKVDQSYVDTEGDILLLEAFLNDDPSFPPQNQGNYLPQAQKELKICEAKTDKYSFDEPPEVELKDLPPHIKYAFLEGDDKLPVIIAKDLSVEEQTALIMVLKSHKRAILGNSPISRRRVNPKIHDVIKNEVLKLLDAGLIYPISNSSWVSPVHCVPKKGGFTVVENEKNELILTRLVTGWRVCIDYRKLNEATHKDHFPLHFMDQMLKRLAGNEYYCFLDGFSGYFQIPIDLKDQEKAHSLIHMERLPTAACILVYAMHRARFRERMLKRCEDTNLCLNWEKSPFMVKEGIVLSHKISKNEIEVDKAKVDVISKLPHPTTIKGIRSFLGHAGLYRRFIQDFSKIARPMTRLLEKDTPLFFSKECVEAFQTLKRKLTEASILIALDWDLCFLMCDASDFAIGAEFAKSTKYITRGEMTKSLN